jgi:hypothetical protein
VRRKKRKSKDQDQGELEITILPNGKVLLPRGCNLMIEIAEILGDEKAKTFTEQAALTEVLIGKRMCG